MTSAKFSFWDFYHTHFLWIELCIAALIAAGFWVCMQTFWTDDDFTACLFGVRQTVYASIISLSASLLGFVIASIPIILGFGQMHRLKIVRDSGHYAQVFQIFFQAIYWLAFAVFWAICAIIIDKDSSPRVEMSYVMVFFLLALSFRVFRCVWVLKKITQIATKEIATVSTP